MKGSASRPGSVKVAVIASVACVLAVGVAIVLLVWPWMPSPERDFVLPVVGVSADPFKLDLLSQPTGPGDGADDIQRAVRAYEDCVQETDKRRQTDRASAGGPDLDVQLARLYAEGAKLPMTVLPFTCAQHLRASADKSEFNFADNCLPKAQLEWREPAKLFKGLMWVGKTAILEGRLDERRGRREEAEKTYRAVLLYGHRLANTHVRTCVQMCGLEIEREAAGALAGLWSKPPANKQMASAADQYARAVSAALDKRYAARGRLFLSANEWHPGNLILTARKHPDAAWRVDALLSLGMARYSSSGIKHEKAILRYLRKAAEDENPYVAAAAAWSRDLEPEVYRVQSGMGRN